MLTAIRLAPSGPVIGNIEAPLGFGPGARLRLTETNAVLGGSNAVPTFAEVISAAGFGDTNAIVLTLATPKEGYKYRASVALDIINGSTNTGGEVVVYLDASVDGGATYTQVAANNHIISSEETNSGPTVQGRNVKLDFPMTLGTSLGIDDTVPTPTLKLRARMQSASATPNTLLQVFSPSTSGGQGVTGLAGTFHMELEECFA